MKVKLLLKYIACSFNVLLLSSTFQVVRADQNNKCPSVNNGSTCVNIGGTINNTIHIYNPTIINSSQNITTLPPSSVSSSEAFLIKDETRPVPQESLVLDEKPSRVPMWENDTAFILK